MYSIYWWLTAWLHHSISIHNAKNEPSYAYNLCRYPIMRCVPLLVFYSIHRDIPLICAPFSICIYAWVNWICDTVTASETDVQMEWSKWRLKNWNNSYLEFNRIYTSILLSSALYEWWIFEWFITHADISICVACMLEVFLQFMDCKMLFPYTAYSLLGLAWIQTHAHILNKNSSDRKDSINPSSRNRIFHVLTSTLASNHWQ